MSVAAIAEPPQIDDPTPTKIAILLSNFSHFCNKNATTNETAMVEIIIGNDCVPTLKTCVKFKPKPNKTTAACKIYFDVKAIPSVV